MGILHALGFSGQARAEQYLKGKGYKIIGKNFRTRYGEIDLIARDGDILVFVEVKTRRSTAFGMPEEAVTATKQRHLISAAQIYLSQHKIFNAMWRIDVIGLLGKGDDSWEIRHFPNAVSGN